MGVGAAVLVSLSVAVCAGGSMYRFLTNKDI